MKLLHSKTNNKEGFMFYAIINTGNSMLRTAENSLNGTKKC